ncbi:MAG: hypothetical protein ABI534_00215 [Chloroflexota bacterium]
MRLRPVSSPRRFSRVTSSLAGPPRLVVLSVALLVIIGAVAIGWPRTPEPPRLAGAAAASLTSSPTPRPSIPGTPSPSERVVALASKDVDQIEPGIDATQTPAPTAVPVARATVPSTAAPAAVAVLGSGAIVGYGGATVGGDGGRVVDVGSIDELRAAMSDSGPRIVRLVGSGVWDAGGAELTISKPNITIDGAACSCQIRNGWIKVAASQVILRNLRVRTGDESVQAADADAISINGGTEGISNIVLDHVEAIWAPDIGGVAILNRVTDVTVQNSIIGEGLYLSRHPEGIAAEDGHSYGFNITTLDGRSFAERLTVHHNLITTSSQRNPQIIAAAAVDFVNNVIYDAGLDWAYGNPRSANIVNNIYRAGPQTQTSDEWRSRTNGDVTGFFAGSVYLSGNVADGFTFTRDVADGVLTDSAPVPLSIGPESTKGLLERVLSGVGPRPADATTQRILSDVWNLAGAFRNGVGQPGPNPVWP